MHLSLTPDSPGATFAGRLKVHRDTRPIEGIQTCKGLQGLYSRGQSYSNVTELNTHR